MEPALRCSDTRKEVFGNVKDPGTSLVFGWGKWNLSKESEFSSWAAQGPGTSTKAGHCHGRSACQLEAGEGKLRCLLGIWSLGAALQVMTTRAGWAAANLRRHRERQHPPLTKSAHLWMLLWRGRCGRGAEKRIVLPFTLILRSMVSVDCALAGAGMDQRSRGHVLPSVHAALYHNFRLRRFFGLIFAFGCCLPRLLTPQRSASA